MKKLLFLLIAATMFAASATAQYDPISLDLARKHQDTTNTLLTQFKAANTYTPMDITASYIQTISAHYDTVTGNDYLHVVTASRLDSIKLKRSNYDTGQMLKFICTNASNDSTLFIPNAGTINGDSTFWWTGTYKNLTLWFDGTNYWKL